MRLFTCTLALGLMVWTTSTDAAAQDPARPATGAGQAQPGKGQPRQRPQFNADTFLKDHDKNNDGKLTKEELPEELKAGFADIDSNKDGSLSADELRQHAERMSARRPMVVEVLYWAIDVPDRDPLSADELQSAYEALRKIDKNNDGKIADDELQTFRATRRQERIETMRKRLDRNNDGKITKDEVRGIWAENFEKLDANKDGNVDEKELEAALTPARDDRNTGTGDRPKNPDKK